MTRLRAEMVRLLKLAARRRLALAYLMVPVALAPTIVPACYSTGDGTPPPPAAFYFPVGMTVSKGGNVLYVVNSDFDLQWNGGTIESYDLFHIRRDAAISAAGYSLSPQLPLPEGGGLSLFVDATAHDGAIEFPDGATSNLCATGDVLFLADGGLVSSCAPFINSTVYERDSVTIGAFATDIQLSPWGNRLYVPVRGDASLTWLTVASDYKPIPDPTDPSRTINSYAPPSGTAQACDADGGITGCYAPFTLVCGQGANAGRCDATHHAGVNPNEPGNTRNLTMPGEPFAMAQTASGTAIVLTHQSEGDTSLFLTGFTEDGGEASPSTPSMQYIVDAGLPMGGDGIADVPHDPAAFGCDVAAGCHGFPAPALLETNNTTAELSLIRYYSDDGTMLLPDAAVPDANISLTTTLPRPFIEVERTYAIASLSSGTDSRGIAIDTSQRLKCESIYPVGDADHDECARKYPARVFFANRAPNTLVTGTIGGPSATDPAEYDADALTLGAGVPLDSGPSRVYLAPIIDSDGNYALRVFVVCFDENSIVVVNPDTNTTEATIAVGGGPFAMAFDPFAPLDVALAAPVQPPGKPVTVSFNPGDGSATEAIPLPSYRFAYVASFTNSYVQVIDLNNSERNKATFETVVYTLGTPSVPKGNQ